MKLSTIVKPIGTALILSLLWLLLPVYWFKAHKGDAPLPPFGWHSARLDAPSVQDSYDPRYQEAGNRVLLHLSASRIRIGAPAISAAVAIDGNMVWRGAVGWADLKSGAPVTTDTVFRIGSTSKAITGTALARLVDQGVVNLDMPISHYMGDSISINPDWKNITPRQLASHTAGLPHYKENQDWVGRYRSIALRTHYSDVREAVDVFDQSPLLFEPGTGFHYSTLGTVLLGAVMSHAAGKPYRDIIQEEVLAPAAMTSTMVAPARPTKEANLATFYLQREGQYREWRPVDLSHRLPGGGYASSPTDLVRMGSLQLDPAYLEIDTRNEFWTPQTLLNGKVNEQNYALGWRWREWDVPGVGIARNANHGGVSRGSQNSLIVFPEHRIVIAYSINLRTESFHEFGMIYEDIFREFALAARPL